MKVIAGILTIILLGGCNALESLDTKPELTSPCVGVEGSPCGPKRPVNDWWQHKADPADSVQDQA